MFKRLLSVLMCTAVVFQSVPLWAGETAEETAAEPSGGASELISYTKKLFSIGSGYDEFDYTYSTEADSGITGYYFNWRDSQNDTNISVSIDSGKYVQRYNKSFSSQKGLGTVTETEAKKAAESFLSLVVPEEYVSNIKFEKISSLNYDSSFSISYRYYVNEIPCDFGSFSIRVSKHTGEVTYYSAPEKCPFEYDYPDSEGVLTAYEAHIKYKEYCEPVFEYLKTYDSETDKYFAFPAYYISDAEAYITDAFTGEVITEEEYADYNSSSGSSASFDAVAETAEEEDSGYELTEAEISSIKDKEDLITSEEALSALEAEIYIGSRENLYCNLVKYSEDYFWNINMNSSELSLYADINAVSGRPTFISFYYYDEEENEAGASADYETMYEYSAKLVNSFTDEEYSQTELEYEESTYESDPYPYEFRWIRTYNGIKYRNNRITVLFDKKGRLIRYVYTWDKDCVFSSIDGAIGTDSAYEKIFETREPELTYYKTKDGIKLVYMFYYTSVYLDKDGNRINRNGTPYTETEAFGGYTDIEGSKYEDIIKLLLNNGYYIEREEFKPNEAITTEDFGSFFKLGYEETEKGFRFYDVPDKYYSGSLTRYEAAEILAHTKVISAILKPSAGIYGSGYYKDEIAYDYLPSVAICYSLGYMRGDQNDCFNGENTLTNGEAAIILYNYLTAETD